MLLIGDRRLSEIGVSKKLGDRRVVGVADRRRAAAGWSLWGGFKSRQSPLGHGRGGGGGGGESIYRPAPAPRACSPVPACVSDKKVTKSNFPAPADLLALLPH